MSTDPAGGSATPVDVEFGSIEGAITRMKNVASEIAKLESDFKGFAGGVSPTDWSAEASCVQFGSGYKAALDVYADVIAGMHTDLENYAAALQAAYDSYTGTDASAAAALAKLGTADDGTLSQDGRGRSEYDDPAHHGQLSSDHPEQATDTTPGDSRTTTLPTTGGGSGGSSTSTTSTTSTTTTTTPTSGGAGQSTQTTGAGQGNLK